MAADSFFANRGDDADMAVRYGQAARVFDGNVENLVLNETVTPHWLGPDGTFWYRRQTEQGCEYVRVSADGTQGPLFDHAEIATGLRSKGADADMHALDLRSWRPDGSGQLRVGGGMWRVMTVPSLKVEAEAAPLDPAWLPDSLSRRALVVEGYDLHIVDLGSGARIALTQDGEPAHAWGKPPDAAVVALARQRGNLRLRPFGWAWSPDGERLVGGRWDEREVEIYPIVQPVPEVGFRPKIWSVRQPLVGERAAAFGLWIIDPRTGAQIRVAALDDANPILEPPVPLAWDADNRRFWIAAVHAAGRELRLTEVDAATGTARTCISESPEGFAQLNSELYNAGNVHIIAEGREAIWWSQRSGWGHLYRYDLATGTCLGALTSGEWVVRDIVHVDEGGGRLFFTGGGREGGDPYQRRLYRVDLAGGEPVLLTPDAGDHHFAGAPAAALSLQFAMAPAACPISPGGLVFVDTVSTAQSSGVTTLRSVADGAVLADIEHADARALYATGWRAPEAFTVIAADGRTELRGVLYRPDRRDQPVPLIDAIYAGPQVSIVPHDFRSARSAIGGTGRAALAALGFAVMVLDGRGTPMRSRAFHDAAFGGFPDIALDDHVAAIAQLCARDPRLDATRVGVYGHSFGGYVSARAILRHPDLFKVAVSSAGSQNYQGMYDAVRLYLPPPDYGDSAATKPSPGFVPANYAALDNASLAANLAGKLLLALGDLDENAYPAVTLQLIDALIKANRSPDLLYLPNRTHGFAREPYFVRRLWDYFTIHLLGARPPQDFKLEIAGAGAGPVIG